MTGLPSILYLLICLSWQTSSSLSEKAFQDHLPPPIFSLDDLIHISLHREKRAASIRIPSSRIIMSAGRILQIPCDTSISGSTIAWAKDTLNNIVSNRKSLFTSSVTTAWSGTYFCIVSQGSLSTFASVTVNIVPLPRKEVISVYTPTPVITSCGTRAQIFCCVTDPGFSSYTIQFSNDNSPKRDQYSNCYFTYVTVDCTTGSTTTVSCVVSNCLGDSVTSDNIIVSYVEASSGDCKADISQGLPSFPSGFTYNVSCVTIDTSWLGIIAYTCIDGIWYKTANFCYSVVVFQQLVNVKNVIEGPEIQQALPQLLQNISATAFNEKQNIADSSATLQLMVDIISTVSNGNVTVDSSMMQNFLKTVDVVVTKSSAWSSNANESVTILNSVERFAGNLNFNGIINFGDDSLNNIQLYGKVVSKDESYNRNFSLQNLTGNVFIDKGVLPGNSTSVVTIAYGTMKDILPNTTQGVLNGLVMSTIIIKNSCINIDNSTFQINMNFSERYSSLVNPECVWYDYEQNGWNNSGCTSIRIDNVISCSCNHLASLSIFMGSSIPFFLEIITFIAVGISLACLMLALLIEALVWNSVIKNKTSYIRHVCLVNVAVTLLIADIWFITAAALGQNTKSPACKAASYFGFFFYLCGFFWMLNTGLFLFYRVIYVLHDMSRKTMMIIAFLLGYGCPLLITVVTVALTEPSEKFLSKKFCWFDYNDSKSLFVFLGLVLVITFVNILILVVVISKLMRCTIGKQSGKKGRMIFLWIAKTFVILNPLLGITWGFELGVLIHPEDIVIRGIFATFKSFQGLFILISTAMLTKWCGKQ